MQSGLGTRHNVNILGCCFHIKMPIVKLALSKLLSQCAFELRKKKSLFSPPPLKWSFTMLSVGKKRRKMSLDVFYRIGIKNYWPPFIYADSLARLNFIPQSQGGPTLTSHWSSWLGWCRGFPACQAIPAFHPWKSSNPPGLKEDLFFVPFFFFALLHLLM